MIEPYLIANLNVDIDLSKLCGPPINSGVCVFVVVGGCVYLCVCVSACVFLPICVLTFCSLIIIKYSIYEIHQAFNNNPKMHIRSLYLS